MSFSGLYLHIPFCARKCGYCDFYSGRAPSSEIDAYLAALAIELEIQARRYGRIRPTTVFMGGGTPSLLTPEQISRLAQSLHRVVELDAVEEFTCEINPGSLTDDKAEALVALGVNRASMGVQSFQPRHLATLDRAHEAGRLESSVAQIRRAGIQRLSLDLMFGIPGQTMDEWRDDLHQALAFEPEHLSAYALTYEDDVPITRRRDAGAFDVIDPELERAMYLETLALMRASGFRRYEVSNYARPGAECRHNLMYWRCGDWLGIGASAHSAYGNRRWATVADHRHYTRAFMQQTESLLAVDETTDREQQADELLLMGLRLEDGVEDAQFRARIGVGLYDRYGPMIDDLVTRGLLIFDGGRLRASDEGFLVLDALILELSRVPLAEVE